MALDNPVLVLVAVLEFVHGWTDRGQNENAPSMEIIRRRTEMKANEDRVTRRDIISIIL